MLKIGSDFYILASSLASRRSTRVLAGGESFALLDAGGDILESPLEALGFFHRDTRYLSSFELKIAGEVMSLLKTWSARIHWWFHQRQDQRPDTSWSRGWKECR